jgi:hypothetical protein
MSELTIDLFAEDHAHEGFLKALIGRLAVETGREIIVRVRAARGGHGRALDELDDYRRRIEKAAIPAPDLFVIAIDANCKPLNEARRAIEKSVLGPLQGKTAIACPDPHIERWFMADPPSFYQVVGSQPTVGRQKCGRGVYKALLIKAIRDAGHIPTLGGIEFAQELVEAMDLYRAAKNDRSLGMFIEDMREVLQSHGKSATKSKV